MHVFTGVMVSKERGNKIKTESVTVFAKSHNLQLLRFVCACSIELDQSIVKEGHARQYTGACNPTER